MSQASSASTASTSASASACSQTTPRDLNVEAFASLISYPVDDKSSERLVAWKAIEVSPKHAAFFHLFDNDRRVEILQSGVFRLHLYLEPVDADVSTYYLEVNGTPLPSHHAQSFDHTDHYRGSSSVVRSARSSVKRLFRTTPPMSMARSVNNNDNSSSSSSSDAPIRPNVAVKFANVFEVRLRKWDMVVVRRKSNWIGSYGGRTAFGRFLLEAMRP